MPTLTIILTLTVTNPKADPNPTAYPDGNHNTNPKFSHNANCTLGGELLPEHLMLVGMAFHTRGLATAKCSWVCLTTKLAHSLDHSRLSSQLSQSCTSYLGGKVMGVSGQTAGRKCYD